MTDDELNKMVADCSDSLVPQDIRHIFCAIHKENKKMVLRMFGNEMDLLNILLVILSHNPNVADVLLERLQQIELLKMRLMTREGGNA